MEINNGFLFPEENNKDSLFGLPIDEQGHQLAKRFIYPMLFEGKIGVIENVGNKKYDEILISSSDSEIEKVRKAKLSQEKSLKKKHLDYELGVDTIIRENKHFGGVSSLRTHTVQERALSVDYNDICIRLTNDNGNPSEYFRFCTMHLLTMIVQEGKLRRWIWVPHAARIIDFLEDGTLGYTIQGNKSNFSHSKFITVNIHELKKVIPEVLDWKEDEGFGHIIH